MPADIRSLTPADVRAAAAWMEAHDVATALSIGMAGISIPPADFRRLRPDLLPRLHFGAGGVWRHWYGEVDGQAVLASERVSEAAVAAALDTQEREP